MGNMPRQRDPLSIEYDSFSVEFLGILRDDMYGWHSALVRSPAGDPVDARGLSAHERAVKRSLYYVLNTDGERWVKNQDESLQVEFAAPETPAVSRLRRLLRLRQPVGERRRVLNARLTSGLLAAQYVPSDGYVFNEAEQAQNLNL